MPAGTSPRPLTPEVRRRVGLPPMDGRPYRWTFAMLVVGLAGTPLLLAGYWRGLIVVAVAGLGIVPAARFLERREAMRRERVYTHGQEARGHVLAVEPGSDADGDRLVRVEFWSDGAKYETSVTGCKLARQGLAPGEDVVVLFDPAEPQRCLVIDRARGGIVDAI